MKAISVKRILKKHMPPVAFAFGAAPAGLKLLWGSAIMKRKTRAEEIDWIEETVAAALAGYKTVLAFRRRVLLKGPYAGHEPLPIVFTRIGRSYQYDRHPFSRRSWHIPTLHSPYTAQAIYPLFSIIDTSLSMYPFATKSDAETFADMVAEALIRKQLTRTETTRTSFVTFAEAMATLKIGRHALKRRLDKKKIVTWRYGKGKAFDRFHLRNI